MGNFAKPLHLTTLAVFASLMLGCSVQYDNPNYAYSKTTLGPDTEWPDLLSTAQLESLEADDPRANSLGLAARIARLNARVRALEAAEF